MTPEAISEHLISKNVRGGGAFPPGLPSLLYLLAYICMYIYTSDIDIASPQKIPAMGLQLVAFLV